MLKLLRIVITLLICSNVYAQSSGATTASITGKITDSSSSAVSGAEIEARNTTTNLMREALSGEDGAYLIAQLPPGVYTVTVRASGFTTTVIKERELVLGVTALLNVELSVAGLDSVVEINAGNSINEGKTESSTNIGAVRIDNLPINRRNFLDFSLTAPRVTTDGAPTTGATATSGLSVNGQTARNNNITIDGLDNNDLASGSVRSTFSQEAVREFQVISDSYSAEFGRALGGVINIVTKGGGNDLRGRLFFLARNDEISARDVFAAIEPDYRQYQFGATASGPLKKDRAFLFASFERLTIKQNNIVTISDQSVRSAQNLGFFISNGPVPVALGTTTALARADARISDNDTLFVRYNYGGSYNGALEPFGGIIAESNGGAQRLDDNSLAVNNNYINSGLNLINETRFLFSRRDQRIDPLGPGPSVRLIAPEGNITFGRNNVLPQPRLADLYQIVNNVTLSRGKHLVKFGGDLYHIGSSRSDTSLPIAASGLAIFTPFDFSALTGIPGLPSFTGLQAFDPGLRTPAQRAFLTLLSSLLPSLAPGFPNNVPLTELALPLVYSQGFGDTRIAIAGTFFSAFIQDDIRLKPNLLLKAGLRYDINRVRFGPDNNGNISPRLALAFRPERLPRLNLRASYGIFVATPLIGPIGLAQLSSTSTLKLAVIPFPFSILPFARPGHNFPASDQIPADVNFIPQLSQIFTVQPDLRNSYSHQAALGIDYLLGETTIVSVNYNLVRGVKVASTRDINPVVRPVPGNPLAGAITGRVDTSKGANFDFESAFDSYYHAFTLSLNRRFSRGLSLLANYTLSKSIDNTADIRIDIADEPNDPLQPGLERGLSLQDVRHRLVVSGVWDINITKNLLLKDYQISAIISANSGRPYNLLAGFDLNQNGAGADRPPGLGRNAGVMPGFASVDVRFARAVDIADRCRLQGFVEVFNLFNRVNISEVDRNFPPDAQGRFPLPPRDDNGRFIATPDRFRNAFAPRQLQLGLRVSF